MRERLPGVERKRNLSSKQSQAVEFCPHCCSRTPQRIVHVQEYCDRSVGNAIPSYSAYYVAVCGGCEHLLLYHRNGHSTAESWSDLPIVYPSDGSLHVSIPERVRRHYATGFKVRATAAGLYAVQLRKALEAVLRDRNCSGPNLARKLNQLASRGELPPTLARASDLVRVLGNEGAHDNDSDLTNEQVIAIDEFFRAIVGYVYVLPSRLADQERRQRAAWHTETDSETADL